MNDKMNIVHSHTQRSLLFNHNVMKSLYLMNKISCVSPVLLFRFCEEVFHGPLSIQEQWITHLQKHILSLGYKGKASPPAAPVAASALVHPVAV